MVRWVADETAGSSGRGARNVEKREVILAQAAAMFADEGYDAVSLNGLADRLNVTKPTLYYYFRSKDEILLQVKLRAQSDVFRAIDAAEAVEGSGEERLKTLLRGYISVMASDFGRCLITVKRSALDPGQRHRFQGEEKIAENRILAILAGGIEDGSLAIDDMKVAYQAMFGMLNWIAVWYKARGRVQREPMIDQIISMLFNGISAKG